jgi:phage-related tail fiber protein
MPMVEGKTDAPSTQETVQKEVEPKAMMAQEKFSDVSDAPVVATSRKEETLTGLNAKITPVVDTGKGATAAWQTISKGVTKQRTDKKSMKGDEGVNKAAVTADANSLPLDDSGRLSFFLIDAHEEAFGASPGSLYLFGKVLVMRNIIMCSISYCHC